VTAVVLLGAFPPLRLFPEPGALRSFDPAAAGAGRLVELVAEDLAAHGTVLALHPTWDGGAGLHLVRMVRSALDSSRVVPVATALPPLAVAVLGAQLAAVAPYLPGPGPLVPGVDLLGSRLAVGAWTSSVSRLERPSPSLGQHLRSWWPRSRFVVTVQPGPRVDAIRRRRPFDAAGWAVPGPSLAVLGSGGGDAGWLHEVVLPAVGAERVVETGPSPLGAAGGARRGWSRSSAAAPTRSRPRPSWSPPSRASPAAGAGSPSRARSARCAGWPPPPCRP
jgi:hypothetical protein